MPDPKVFYAEDIADMQCGHPGCDHSAHKGHEMVLKANCHMRAGLSVRYVDGTLVMHCQQCGKYVTTVKVASKKEIN